MANSDNYEACVNLACKMNSDPEVYKAFKAAMTGPGEDFASWLNANGVPADIAQEVANQSGEDLYKTVGLVVCKRFW